MTSLRLFMDEDSMDRDLVEALRDRDLDVATVADAGLRRVGDRALLEYATSEGRVLYTFNVADFARIHSEWIAQGLNHAGLILGNQQRYSVGGQMRRILEIAASLSAEDMVDRLEFLSNWA